MKHWIGIDPGASGCMCILYEDNTVDFYDYKSNQLQTYIDAHIDAEDLQSIAVERVSSRTGQGVKSVFSFGQRLGEIEGMLQTLGLHYNTVPPQTWQKYCNVEPKSGKLGIAAAITALYPDIQVYGPRGGLLDGRCDALGLAHYAKHK